MLLSRQLHAASLPFVTRALRGGRKLRYIGTSLLLAVLTVLVGFWVALGSGSLEHELRVGFKLEQPMYRREQQEFKIFADDPTELRALEAAARELGTPANLRAIARGELQPLSASEYRVHDRLHEAFALFDAVRDGDHFNVGEELRAPAAALMVRHGIDHYETDRYWAQGSDAEMREQLRTMLARDLVPEVSIYSSPFTVVDAVRITGLVAGGVALLLLMLFTPVLTGTQMAQEVHENTLQPLTGTALSARDLVIGLTLGPVTVIALLVAPQLLLFLAAAAVVGNILPALGMIAVALAGAAFLTMLAQLAGLALCGQRSSGMLGVGLLAVLAPLTMLGAALALELPARAVGVLALLPQAAASHMLLESFLPAGSELRCPGLGSLELGAAQQAVVLGALGMLCFAWLGKRALERKIGETSPSALSRGEALLGALVSVALVTLANPYRPDSYHAGSDFYLVNLVMVLVPMMILLMMRVPMSETPTALRRVPVGSLLAELAVAVTVFFAVCVGAMGPGELELARSPIAVLYVVWTVAVAGLLAIRVAALPMTVLARLWAGVCVLGLGVAVVHAVDWTEDPIRGLDEVLGFWRISPLLGVLQGVMLALIPALLLRALWRPASTAPVDG